MCVHVRVRSASRRPGFLIVWVCVVVVQGAHHRHLQAPKGGASKGGERPVEVSHRQRVSVGHRHDPARHVLVKLSVFWQYWDCCRWCMAYGVTLTPLPCWPYPVGCRPLRRDRPAVLDEPGDADVRAAGWPHIPADCHTQVTAVVPCKRVRMQHRSYGCLGPRRRLSHPAQLDGPSANGSGHSKCVATVTPHGPLLCIATMKRMCARCCITAT